MPAIERSFDASELSPILRDALRRRLRELGGLALIAVAALLGARARNLVGPGSLAQPRDQYAGTQRVRPAWGAIVADLMTQLLGVAALAFMLPVAIWGWRLSPTAPCSRERMRLLFWMLGVLACRRLRRRAAAQRRLAAARRARRHGR